MSSKNVSNAFKQLVEDQAAVTALIGTRLWYDRLPQNPVLPAATFSLVDETGLTFHTTDGQAGPGQARMHFSAWAQDIKTARNIADALVTGVNGFRGTKAGTTLQGVFLELFEPVYEEDPTLSLWRVMVDFTVVYS